MYLYIIVDETTTLKVNTHLLSVKGAIWEARSQWRDIGRLLPGVTEGTISAIHEPNDSECLHKVLTVWIQSGSASIYHLLNALENKTVSRFDISKAIRDRTHQDRTDVGL